jgi:hypothetical protein
LIPREGGAATGVSFEFEYLGEFEFIFDTALGYESGGWGKNFDATNCKQNMQNTYLVTLSL